MKFRFPLGIRLFGWRTPVLAGSVLTLAGLLSPQDASGATAVSRIFGAVPVVADGAADTVLSVPLKIPAVFRATVGSVSESTITFSGTPNLTEDQFVYVAGIQPQTYYLFFESGDLAGRVFTITGNSTTSVTLAAAAAATADDAVAIHPYWTLATLFSSDQGLASATNAGERPIEVILPAVESDGINPAAEAVYYHGDGAWRRVGAAFDAAFDDTILPPDRPVVVRMNQDEDATLVLTGEVTMSALSLPVRARADGPQDNLLSLTRPLDVSLDDSGLAGSGAFETTTDSGQIKDRVVLYAGGPGQNRVPTDAYFYLNGGWRKEGDDPATDHGSVVIKAGQGFVIRKAEQAGDPVEYWVNTFNP
ncbi:MAG: hypothetical protein DRP71_07265 [Verrucomicrobia bacterium]|nr:MAG: hypothetical protein DRP71_07265 [Verrucomicrobiota bacterium]